MGWVAVTASRGPCALTVHAPPDVLVTERDPLLPFEKLRATAATFTGGRVLRNQKKKKPKNRRAPGRKQR